MQSVACGKLDSCNLPNESSRNWVQQGWCKHVSLIYQFNKIHQCSRFARCWIRPEVYPVRESWSSELVPQHLRRCAVFHYCQYRGWCLPYNHDLRDGLIVFRPASPDKRESRHPFISIFAKYFEIVNVAFYVFEWFLWKMCSGFILYSPDKISLRSFPKPLTSCKAVVTLSSAPNKLSRPRVRSIRKNMMDQKVAPGIWLMASVNAMNTSPGPLAACWINVQVVS